MVNLLMSTILEQFNLGNLNQVSTETRRPYNVTKVSITGLIIDHQGEEFLNQNMDVVLAIPEIISAVNKTIGYDMIPTLEIIEDEESANVRRLAFVFTIKDKKYEEILNMWDVVSKNVYEKLNDVTAKKIAIILEGV